MMQCEPGLLRVVVKYDVDCDCVLLCFSWLLPWLTGWTFCANWIFMWMTLTIFAAMFLQSSETYATTCVNICLSEHLWVAEVDASPSCLLTSCLWTYDLPEETWQASPLNLTLCSLDKEVEWVLSSLTLKRAYIWEWDLPAFLEENQCETCNFDLLSIPCLDVEDWRVDLLELEHHVLLKIDLLWRAWLPWAALHIE